MVEIMARPPLMESALQGTIFKNNPPTLKHRADNSTKTTPFSSLQSQNTLLICGFAAGAADKICKLRVPFLANFVNPCFAR